MSQLAMRRPDLADLPPLPSPLPDGYTLRLCEKSECAALASVLDLAFPGDGWNVEKTNKNLLEAEDVRATFVIEHGGSLVATASVQMPPGVTAAGGTGTVHWVGADPGHKGRRLGYLVTLAVLHRFLEEGCVDADLSTDDARLPAIKTYLNLGFIPDYRDETHPLRWSRIFQALAPR